MHAFVCWRTCLLVLLLLASAVPQAPAQEGDAAGEQCSEQAHGSDDAMEDGQQPALPRQQAASVLEDASLHAPAAAAHTAGEPATLPQPHGQPEQAAGAGKAHDLEADLQLLQQLLAQAKHAVGALTSAVQQQEAWLVTYPPFEAALAAGRQ
jgi:hypothetical protein